MKAQFQASLIYLLRSHLKSKSPRKKPAKQSHVLYASFIPLQVNQSLGLIKSWEEFKNLPFKNLRWDCGDSSVDKACWLQSVAFHTKARRENRPLPSCLCLLHVCHDTSHTHSATKYNFKNKIKIQGEQLNGRMLAQLACPEPRLVSSTAKINYNK